MEQRSTLLIPALLVTSLLALPADASELSAVKPLTKAQEEVRNEQEELYDQYQNSPSNEYPNLIVRLQNLLKKQETAFGSDSPQVSCTLDELWDIYRLQKNAPPQIPVAQRSMEIKRKLLGPQAVDTALATCHLANALAANNQHESALSLLQKYLKQLDPTETRSAEIMTIYEIAQTYYQWNKFAEAQPWFDRAIGMKTKYAPQSRVYPTYRKAVMAQRANQRLVEQFGKRIR